MVGFLVAVSLLGGCNSRPKTYPVEGKVTFPDNTPLVGATVEFESQEAETKGVNARGEVGEDGTYRLKTGREDGAVEGLHRVIVVPPPYPPGNMSGPAPKEVLHSRFRSYETSGLQFTVKPEPNRFNISVDLP
jgi:hypothetical protein